MTQHRFTRPFENHSVNSFVVSDLAARENTVVTEDDDGKVCWQQDDNSFWILKSALLPPATRWVPFGIDPNAATKAYVEAKVAEIEAELAAI